MNWLTTVVPGLREIRAPLAAGYLTLFAAWIVYGDDLPDEADALGFADRLYDLADSSPILTAVALAFVAYLIGVSLDALLGTLWRRLPAPRGTGIGFDLLINERLQETLMEYGIPEGSRADVLERVLNRVRSGSRSLMDMEVMKISMLATQPSLYAEYNRFDSEAEFASALVVPLVLVVAALGIVVDPRFWLAGVIIFPLIARYRKMRNEADRTILMAMTAEQVASPILRRMRDHIPHVRDELRAEGKLQ